MKYDSVLDDIRNISKKKMIENSHKRIITVLDNTISLYPRRNHVKNNDQKCNIDLIIHRINKLYGDLHTSPLNPLPLLEDKNKSTSTKDLFKFEEFKFPKYQPPQNRILPWFPKTPPIEPEQFVNIKRTKITIDREINGLCDILQLIDDYPLKLDIEYNINMKALHDIKKPLKNLNEMIGMQALKDSIVDQIVFFAQDLHKGNDFMHTVIYGPPGTGKTEIAKIMGEIFSTIGILKNKKFKKVTRSDLIAGYLGKTGIKTRDVIKSCLGGVLFIDEAYALGNREKRDSFAKECIDTLCEALSDNKEQLMVIIAGYEEDLNKCFFAYNQGLNSRFPWRFHTDDYKASELNLIFQKKVKEIGWSLKNTLNDDWFEDKWIILNTLVVIWKLSWLKLKLHMVDVFFARVNLKKRF